MFERFTDRARRVIVLAQEEARDLRHNYIGPEHILLGICREGEGVGALTLQSLDLTLAGVRKHVESVVPPGESESPDHHLPFSPAAKKVQEYALREALQLGHNYIGTEHILLALLRQGEQQDEPAEVEHRPSVIGGLGVSLNQVRRQVLKLLSERLQAQVRPKSTDPTVRVTIDRTALATLVATYDALVALGWKPPD